MQTLNFAGKSYAPFGPGKERIKPSFRAEVFCSRDNALRNAVGQFLLSTITELSEQDWS